MFLDPPCVGSFFFRGNWQESGNRRRSRRGFCGAQPFIHCLRFPHTTSGCEVVSQGGSRGPVARCPVFLAQSYGFSPQERAHSWWQPLLSWATWRVAVFAVQVCGLSFVGGCGVGGNRLSSRPSPFAPLGRAHGVARSGSRTAPYSSPTARLPVQQ